MAAYRPRASSVTYSGQSIFLAPPGGPTAPDVISAALVHPPRAHFVANTLGTSYAQRAAGGTDAVVDLQITKCGGQKILIDCGGSSDLALIPITASQLLAIVEPWIDARKAAGFAKVIECTVIPGVGFMGATETQRLAYNTALKASSHPDAVSDIASIPQLANPLDTTYYSDGVHPTIAGAALIAATVQATLATLGIA